MLLDLRSVAVLVRNYNKVDYTGVCFDRQVKMYSNFGASKIANFAIVAYCTTEGNATPFTTNSVAHLVLGSVANALEVIGLIAHDQYTSLTIVNWSAGHLALNSSDLTYSLKPLASKNTLVKSVLELPLAVTVRYTDFALPDMETP